MRQLHWLIFEQRVFECTYCLFLSNIQDLSGEGLESVKLKFKNAKKHRRYLFQNLFGILVNVPPIYLEIDIFR